MRHSTKAFFCCAMISLFLFFNYVALRVRNGNVPIDRMSKEETVCETKISIQTINLKYILQWTSSNEIPLVYMGKGQETFKQRNCSHTNCYITSNRSYLGSYTDFDVIAFAGKEVVHMKACKLPDKRDWRQKYVFATMESSDYYPVCSKKLNGFFNWTWTYRLDSDAEWGYVIVRDSNNKVVGPKINMNWIKLEDMKPVDKKIRNKLVNKTKAVAWFVSNCDTISGREMFVSSLQLELGTFGLKIDTYGRCGKFTCSRDLQRKCNEMLEKDYYFYLAFENSFAEDYVTEKLLYPLQNLAVPIVYGGANYTRFMADGIYLNARELGPHRLAKKINELINNPDQYLNYFKWTNHYSYHKRSDSAETDDICRFCTLLNQEESVKMSTTYVNFRKWWNPPGRC